MRFSSTIYLLALILTASIFADAPQSLAQADNGILVEINEVGITRQQLSVESSLLNAEMRHRNNALSGRQLARLQRQLLQNLIDRELLYQKARQKKIEIRNRWVDRAIIELKAKLKAQSGYKAYLKNAQTDEAQLRARIRKGLIVRRLLRREVIRQIKVSEAEMQAFYRDHPDFFQSREQVRVRQIMVAINPKKEISKRTDALLKIQAIQKRLHEGENFTALAIDLSEDSSKANGGDLGYLQRSQMVAPFADAAFSLKPGEISNIVETRVGYHIIQMVDRIPSSQMAYRNARTKIERTLRRNKENKATATYLAKLKRQATIKRLVRF